MAEVAFPIDLPGVVDWRINGYLEEGPAVETLPPEDMGDWILNKGYLYLDRLALPLEHGDEVSVEAVVLQGPGSRPYDLWVWTVDLNSEAQ